MSRSRVIALGRLVVQAVVILWCLAPLIWFIGVLIITVARNLGRPVAVFPGELGPGMGLEVIGGVRLLMLFSYGAWCAVGVICGFGADQFIQIVDRTLGEFLNKDKPNAPTKP